MTTELLERPIETAPETAPETEKLPELAPETEAPAAEPELAEPEAPEELHEPPETEMSGGYAMKLGRRRKRRRAVAVKPTRAGRRKRQGRPSVMRLVLGIAVPGLLLVVIVRLLGAGSAAPTDLPPELGPSDFTSMLVFDETSRVGPLFHARLRETPDPASDSEFRMRVTDVAARLRSAGYTTIQIQAPDGTTLVSGALDEPTFAPPGTHGT